MKNILRFNKARPEGTREGVISSCTGFTLAEIMVVCAVIAILSAVVVPAILTMLPNWRLKGTARELYSDMQDTRFQAIKANQPWAIIFHTGPALPTPPNPLDPPTYTICSTFGAGTGTVADWVSLGDNTVRKTVDLGQPGVFYGHGTIPAGNSATNPAGPFPATEIDYPIAGAPMAGTEHVLIFNANGTISSAGFVYLQNLDNTVFAIGTQTSGVVMLRRWMGGTW